MAGPLGKDVTRRSFLKLLGKGTAAATQASPLMKVLTSQLGGQVTGAPIEAPLEPIQEVIMKGLTAARNNPKLRNLIIQRASEYFQLENHGAEVGTEDEELRNLIEAKDPFGSPMRDSTNAQGKSFVDIQHLSDNLNQRATDQRNRILTPEQIQEIRDEDGVTLPDGEFIGINDVDMKTGQVREYGAAKELYPELMTEFKSDPNYNAEVGGIVRDTPSQGQGTPADLDQHKADQLDFPNAAQEVLSNAGGPVVKGAQKLFKLFTQGKKASKGVAQVFKDRATAKQKPLQIEDKRQVPLQTEKPKVEVPTTSLDDEIPF